MKLKLAIIFCGITTLALNTHLCGQVYDTITLKPKQVLVTFDHVYYGHTDSVVILNDTVKYIVTRNLGKGTELLLDYFNSVKKRKPLPQPIEVVQMDPASQYFEPYTDKIIRSIRYFQSDIFEGSVKDTTKYAYTKAGKAINAAHISTMPLVLKKNIRFKEDEPLNPYILAENERLLRNLSYIQDAKIYVNPDSIYIDSVDLVVVTQDNIPIGGGIVPTSLDKFRVWVFTNSIAGSGSYLKGGFNYNNKLAYSDGYVGAFKTNNFRGWFVDTYIEGQKDAEKKMAKIGADKQFLSNDTEYGGGIEFKRESTFKNWILYYPDSAVEYRADYTLDAFDVWISKSFYLDKRTYQKSINLSGRYINEYYQKAPTVDKDTNLIFHNRETHLYSITYNNKKYLKTTKLLAFGKTEDVPYGFIANLTLGYQESTYFSRPYGSTLIAAGKYFEKFGYLNGAIIGTTFLYRNIPDDFTFDFKAVYFTPLFDLGSMEFRQFIRPSVSFLSNTRYLNYESFGDRIRALNQRSVYGKSSIALNFHSLFFTPMHPLGFNIAFGGFADLGWLSRTEFFETQPGYFSSFGAILTIRNENLSFPGLNIIFAYSPANEYNGAQYQVIFDFSDLELFKSFSVNKPEVYRDFNY